MEEKKPEKVNVGQRLAVHTRGRPLLVDAAAGSGKTTALVARLMKYLQTRNEDDPHKSYYSLDSFLVITFTRMAAAELRSRIMSALNDEIAKKDPGDPEERELLQHLQHQTELCSRADIGTIDSICGKLLRRYVRYTDEEDAPALPPDFRVIEPDRSELLVRNELGKLLESRYAADPPDKDFLELAGTLGAGRDDKALEETVMSLYNTIRSSDDPEQWLDNCEKSLETQASDKLPDTACQLLDHVRQKTEFCLQGLRFYQQQLTLEENKALQERQGKKVRTSSYQTGVNEAVATLEKLEKFCISRDWDGAFGCYEPSVSIGRAPAGFQNEIKDELKSFYDDYYKKLITGLKQYLPAPWDQVEKERETLRPALSALLGLTRDLLAAADKEKRRTGVVDFADQELLVMKILKKYKEPGDEVSSRWTEVMVDEYQDINRCQEALFLLFSNNGERLFTVGDVKQAIYRFRLADSDIFLERKKRACPVKEGETDGCLGRITMNTNYRSFSHVIHSVNAVFGDLFSPELGEMPYGEEDRMEIGMDERNEKANQPAVPTTITLLPASLKKADPDGGEGVKEDGAEDGTEISALQVEARYVAGEIRRLLAEGYIVTDKNGERHTLRQKDVAILLRNTSTSAPVFCQELERAGLAVVSRQGTDFFDADEITVLLSYLAVIDNPRQDVPLLAVLRSFLFCFTPDELAIVRAKAENRYCDFYTALLSSREENPGYPIFLDELQKYRYLAPELTVADLLCRIANEHNLTAYFAVLKQQSEKCKANLSALLAEASAFDRDGGRGLHEFLDRMARLKESGKGPAAPGGSTDAVQIMSVHRSKGLEYPIVFLCNTNHYFDSKDSAKNVLIHQKLQLGAKYVDTKLGARYPTMDWLAVRDKRRQENLSEELRILYVAMTRARERLYITGTVSNPEKFKAGCKPGGPWKRSPEKDGGTQDALPGLPGAMLEEDSSCLKWLVRCSYRHDDTILKCEAVTFVAFEPGTAETISSPSSPVSRTLFPDSEQPGGNRPPVCLLPSKISASALRPGEEEDEEAVSMERHSPAVRLPRLEDTARKLTEAERGTAFHTALQYVDLQKTGTPEELRQELRRLELEGRLTTEEAAAVDEEKIFRFYASDIGRRIRTAGRVYREQRFTLLEEARNCLPGCESREKILLQGVVDCLIDENGELTVIDYKTGSATPEKLEKYTLQVRAYARAMQRIHQKPVKQGLLCFIDTGRVIPVPAVSP